VECSRKFANIVVESEQLLWSEAKSEQLLWTQLLWSEAKSNCCGMKQKVSNCCGVNFTKDLCDERVCKTSKHCNLQREIFKKKKKKNFSSSA